MFQRSQALLTALLGRKDLCDQWWNNPNRAFDMQTPKQVWDTEPKKVYEYLMHHGYR